MAISSDNAPQVAGAAYNASGSLEGAGLGGAGFLTGAVTATTAGGVDMVEVIIAQLKASQAWFANHAAALVTGAVVTATENCTDGGSLSFTLNDADGTPVSFSDYEGMVVWLVFWTDTPLKRTSSSMSSRRPSTSKVSPLHSTVSPVGASSLCLPRRMATT